MDEHPHKWYQGSPPSIPDHFKTHNFSEGDVVKDLYLKTGVVTQVVVCMSHRHSHGWK